MGTPLEVPLSEGKIPNNTSIDKDEALIVKEEQSSASSIFDQVEIVSNVESNDNISSAQDNIINDHSSSLKMEVERSSSPLSQIQIINSSPLTSVQDLNEDSRDTLSLSGSKKNEDDVSMKSYDGKEILGNDFEFDDSSIKKSQVYQFQKTVKYVKKESSHPAEEFDYLANKSDDAPLIANIIKKIGGREDSGTMAPFESEEGLMLPGRKKPVPPSQINSRDRAGRSFIFKFASNGDFHVTESLLKAGASLRIVDNAGWTPLHEACLNGHENIVELLLSYDADVDAPGGDGDTPLHDAIGNGHLGVIKLLLKHGASLDLHNELHQTPEEFALEKYENLKIESKSNANLEQECKTAKKIVELLKDWRNMTEQVVKRNHDGQTILHLVCSAGNTEDVQKMLDYGADINAADNSGWTPIHNAALHGHSEVVLLLLRYGSDVDPLGFQDETPLHDAVANGHIECASLLLQYGSDPKRKNIDHKMPIDLIPEGHINLKELLSKPLEIWQPVKTPEYYPKVLEPAFAENEAKKEDNNSGKAIKREIPQHWEGLEARGSFESSREEKKFQALLKTLSRSDNSEKSSSVSNEKPKSNIRQSLESSKSVIEKHAKPNVKTEGRKKRQDSVEPTQKRSKTNASLKDQSDTNSSLKSSSTVTSGLVSTSKEKNSPSLYEKKNENTSDQHNNSANENTKSLCGNMSSEVKDLKKNTKPKVVDKPPPVSKLHLALAEASREADNLSFAIKKKKRFTISGYQAAGESSTEVSSESLVHSTLTSLPSKSINDFIPSDNIAEQVKNGFINQNDGLEPGKLTVSEYSNQTKKDKVDVIRKFELEKKFCLPLCAYLKPKNGAVFFKPVNITREGLWGDLPKHDHTKVFIDIQIAFCLGLKNGRELLEKYPNLESRVATTVEKTALEETIVSHRLFTNMLLTMDPNWIPTITVNQLKSLKMTDVDVHLIFWNESLFRILSEHVEQVEKTSSCSLNWLEDLEWPAPLSAEPVEVHRFYVHKLKRLKR